MTLRVRQVATLLLLAIGVEVWLTLGDGIWGNRAQLWWLGGAIAAWAIPPVRRGVAAFLDYVRDPSPRAAMGAALAVTLLSAAYLWLSAHLQHRYLGPSWHDQFCYLIQARIIGRGRLWMPRHPLADFFDSFYLITTPVYTPMYFPGAAMMFAPAVSAGLPIWATPLFACAASAGLLYRVVRELVDGAAALLAVIVLLATSWFRWASMALMGQAPMLLLGMLILWAWLRWRRSEATAWRWELLIGALAGWAASTRPLDAVCFMAPVLAAMLGKINSKSEARNPKQFQNPNGEIIETKAVLHERRRLGHFFPRSFGFVSDFVLRISSFSRWICVGVFPFLVLQLVFNVAVTGHLFQTPYRYYSDRDQPGTSLGFHSLDPDAHPVSKLPQKREVYEQHKQILSEQRLDRIGVTARERLAATLRNTLPQPLVLLWVPLSALALSRRRAVVWVILPLFVGIYLLYTYSGFFSVVAIPSAIVMALLGAKAIESAWPRRQRGLGALSALLLLALAAGALPEVDRTIFDDVGGRPYRLERVDAALRGITRPAVVLFPYPTNGPRPPLDQEPVYNTETAWPDDARIVRAQDLGAENERLFEYYGRVQPWREVYRYDEALGALERLGTAQELARRLEKPATR